MCTENASINNIYFITKGLSIFRIHNIAMAINDTTPLIRMHIYVSVQWYCIINRHCNIVNAKNT